MSSEPSVLTRPSLFDPIQLGPITVPNRIFFAPTSVGYATDGVLTLAALEHYSRRAKGGAGAIMTEHLAVSDEGWQHRRQPAAWSSPAFEPGLRTLAERIQAAGGVAIAQLSHAGRYAGPWHEWASRPRLSAAAVPFPMLGEVVTPREITRDQIADVVAAFAATTRLLIDNGWQGVELHGGSGFLLSSFFSPLMNTRTDDYGGTVAGRVRFAQELLQACQQAAAGRAVVGVHLMTNELRPGGMSPDDVAEYVAPLESAGAQFFRPGAGTFETLRLPENAAFSSGTDFNRASSDALVAAATVPVIANGGLRTGAQARAAIAGGASAVALARPLLADPDWADKVKASAGDAIVSCPCNPPMCLQTQLAGAVCAAWPAEVRENGYFGNGQVWRESRATPAPGKSIQQEGVRT